MESRESGGRTRRERPRPVPPKRLMKRLEQVLLILFGIIAVAAGLYLWHGLGPDFGMGESRGRVSRSAMIVSLGLLAAAIGLELPFFRGV